MLNIAQYYIAGIYYKMEKSLVQKIGDYLSYIFHNEIAE